MRVSDHAVIRYLERALDMDIGAIRKEICAVIASGEIGSEMIVVEDGCAITVLGPDMREMDVRRAKRRRSRAFESGEIRAALPTETGTPLEKHGISEG